MPERKNDRSHSDECYHEVLSLYAALQDIGEFKVQRAEMRHNGVTALPLDFCIDVFLKAKRALSRDVYALGEWEMVLRNPDKYPMVSPVTREKLGRIFEEHDLGVGGAYKLLYFRVKNAR